MLDALSKRNYRQRPGLIAAAKKLGVSYGHLRRVVSTKERTSPKLLLRYRAWQRAAKQTNPQPKISSHENKFPN